MADAICRWRNPYLPTVLELINILPKEEMSQVEARAIVNANSVYDFYKTPYQLACQLGLYHETNGRYYPKFTFIPSNDEVFNYLSNWIINYCVPNPYTNGFEKIEPFSIHSKICSKLYQYRVFLNFENMLNEFFEEQIGNIDILKNSINSYSSVIEVNNGIIILKENKTFEDLAQYIDVDIVIERNNKEYFFDLFTIPNKKLNENISQFETNLINELQELPNLTQTEKNQIISARIGQGYFRRLLISESNFCPITGIDETRLLIASHIKPWRISSNVERINPKNGILLTPTYDKLFDNGYISFRNDKSLLISKRISESNIQKLRLTPNMEIPLLPIEGREDFLDYHRTFVFQYDINNMI